MSDDENRNPIVPLPVVMTGNGLEYGKAKSRIHDPVIEIYDLKKKTHMERRPADTHHLSRLLEAAYRVNDIRHGFLVELRVEPAKMDVDVIARYVLTYERDLSVSVFIACLRAAIMELTGHD